MDQRGKKKAGSLCKEIYVRKIWEIPQEDIYITDEIDGRVDEYKSQYLIGQCIILPEKKYAEQQQQIDRSNVVVLL